MTEASLSERVAAAVAEARENVGAAPRVALCLGSSVELGERFTTMGEVELLSLIGASDGSAIPKLVFGDMAGVPVVVIPGQLPAGASPRETTLPIRVASGLGAEVLIVIGRGQRLNPHWRGAPLMLIVDHINLTGSNPLVGANPDELGPRFPDMSEAYDARVRRLAEDAALARGIRLVRGVYVGRAEHTLAEDDEADLLRRLGGDVVGPGIVHEVIVAVHSGMRVLGIVTLDDATKTVQSAGSSADVAVIVEDVVRQI